jgi:predicted DNA binding CopG/RHH family protein
MISLDLEEQDILESVENGEWHSISAVATEIQRYQYYAQTNTLESVSIKIPINDLQSLQILAQQTGTSVDLLMASVLHQYVTRQS